MGRDVFIYIFNLSEIAYEEHYRLCYNMLPQYMKSFYTQVQLKHHHEA